MQKTDNESKRQCSTCAKRFECPFFMKGREEWVCLSYKAADERAKLLGRVGDADAELVGTSVKSRNVLLELPDDMVA